MRTINVKPWGKGQGAFVTINVADYDPDVHELLEGERLPAGEGPFDLIAGLSATSTAVELRDEELETLTAKIAELSATIAERDQQIEARDQKITELTAALEAAAVTTAVDERTGHAEPGHQVSGATADGQQLPPASKHDYSDEAHARTAKLTVAEIQADLAAMEIEFDPKASKADLLAQRNAERQKRGRPLVGDEA